MKLWAWSCVLFVTSGGSSFTAEHEQFNRRYTSSVANDFVCITYSTTYLTTEGNPTSEHALSLTSGSPKKTSIVSGAHNPLTPSPDVYTI